MDTKHPDVVYKGSDKLEPYWLDKDTGTMSIRNLASGSTTPGATAWQQYGAFGILVDVDTSAAKFETTPVYITSIGGNSSHWDAIGASAVYLATNTSFRVYVKWTESQPLTPELANSMQWHINWIGMESAQ